MPVGTGTGRNLRTGDLTERITFRSPSHAPDHGFDTITYADVFSVWADFLLGAGVLEQTQSRGAWKVEVTFDIHYRTDITPDMRVVWRGKTFEIESVGQENRLGRMSLRCIEESAP